MPSFWQYLSDCERPVDDTQSESTFAEDQFRNLLPSHTQICLCLEHLFMYTDGSMRYRLDDVANFIMSRCSPCNENLQFSTSPSSGIDRPFLHVAVHYCDVKKDNFLQYPGKDECLNNGLSFFIQNDAFGTYLIADAEFVSTLFFNSM